MGIKLSIKKYSHGFKEFIAKTFVFIVAFIVASYVIGQKVVESKLLYGFNIYIYGGMGYIFLFSIIGFVLLYRDKLLFIEKCKYKIIDLAFLILSLAMIVGFYLLELNINNISISVLNIILVHTLFLGMFVFLIIGIYGVRFLHNFMKKFRKELIYFLIFGVIAYSLMTKVWSLWPYLSAIVTRATYFLLKLFVKNVYFISPDILRVNGFAAKIAEACSGVYSIFIFTALYLFIAFVDWNKLNKMKVILLFIPAVIGAFLVNILRVFLLMIVGGYLSIEAALGLYHSYTGMVFFMIYFILFWMFAYKWMKK